MRKGKPILWLIVLGSVWGFNEVLAGEALSSVNVLFGSALLAAWAFLVLAVARGMLNRGGSSTFIAGIAVLYRLVNTSPFFCHLLGIFMLGLAFDLSATLLGRGENRNRLKESLIGITTAFGGYALFALSVTFIFRHDFWVSGGWPKIMNHIFISGSLAAFLASIVVPLGYNLGRRSDVYIEGKSRWTYSWGLLFLVFVWSLIGITG